MSTRRPRIALDLVPIHAGQGGAGGGIWSYASALVSELDNLAPSDVELVCLCRPDQALPPLRHLTRVELVVDSRSPAGRLNWIHFRLPAWCSRHGVAVMHKLATEVPWQLRGLRLVTTVQDFMLEHHRESRYERQATAARRLHEAYFRAMTARCFARSSAVIVASEAVATEARQRFPGAAPRLHVVQHGLADDVRQLALAASGAAVAHNVAPIVAPTGPSPDGAANVAARAPARPLRILALGALLPHKGAQQAIRAFERLAASGPGSGATLTFHGHAPDREFAARVMAAAAASPAAAGISFRGYDPAIDGASLYRDADILLQLSAYEGFGLPPLEAQAAGLPVVCADIPVFREVLGDGAIHVRRDDPAAVAAAIIAVATDPVLRAALTARGRANAARFSWARTARQTLQVYRTLLQAPARSRSGRERA